jgi:transcriptional regulator with XRE-family HTH domain
MELLGNHHPVYNGIIIEPSDRRIMDIKTESDVTGAVARRLREQADLSQKAFWGPIGITQSAGCRYENGQRLPRPIRILVFANYVAGLRIDASTPDGASRLSRLGLLQASEAATEAVKVGAKLAEAQAAIRQANKLLAKP